MDELKLQLLTEGASISAEFTAHATQESRLPASARTGLANGQEIVLPDGQWVNVRPSPRSTLALAIDSHGQPTLVDQDVLYPIRLPPKPRWYRESPSLLRTGTVRGDRLGVALYKGCVYFSEHRQCAFCAIHRNPDGEHTTKRVQEIANLIDIAAGDAVAPVRHVYFNLGNTTESDRGLPIYEELLERLGTNRPALHLNQTVPRDLDYIDYLCSLGIEELSFNLELFSPEYAAQLIPGKYQDIGIEGHLYALQRAVGLLKFPNVSSCLIVGLEPIECTLQGLETLMTMRVVPKLSVFRPLEGSRLADRPAPDTGMLLELLTEARSLSATYRVPLGPICTPCRMLSLV